MNMFFALCLPLAAGAAAAQASERSALLDRAAREQVAADLPVELRSMRLAVLPLAGDADSRLAEAIVAALVERRFTVFERGELDKILKEARIPPDLVDESAAVEQGKIHQAEAVVYGRVRRSWSLPGFLLIEAELKVANVATTQTVWTRRVFARKASPALKPAALAMGVLALLAVLVPLRKSLAEEGKLEDLEEDARLRRGMAVEIEKAKRSMSSAQDNFVRNGNMALAARVKELGLELDGFRREVENAPHGFAAELSERAAGAGKRAGRPVLRKLEGIAAVAGKLRDRAAANNSFLLEGNLRRTLLLVQELRNRWLDRDKAI